MPGAMLHKEVHVCRCPASVVPQNIASQPASQSEKIGTILGHRVPQFASLIIMAIWIYAMAKGKKENQPSVSS